MRRSIIVLLAAGIAVSAAPAASAKTPCKAPGKPAWHSCLTARHVFLADGNVLLRRATPGLTIRLSAPCPAHIAKRTVVLKTKKGKKLARVKVKGTCHGTLARYHTNIRPKNLELKPGTVIRSYWSGIDDSDFAPSVTIGG
jgi:hypothetical protein